MVRYKKSITIGFSKPRPLIRRPISWIVRLFEGSDYSHVYIKLRNTRLQNHIYYHASGSSVKFMGKALFEKNNIAVKEYEFDISSRKFYNILDFAINRAGAPYSILQLFGMIVIRVASIFGKRIKNPFGHHGYICTELVGELLEQIYGKDIVKELDSLTLRDIKLLIEKNDTV